MTEPAKRANTVTTSLVFAVVSAAVVTAIGIMNSLPVVGLVIVAALTGAAAYVGNTFARRRQQP